MKKFLIIIIILYISMGYSFSQSLEWVRDDEKNITVPKGVVSWEELSGQEFFPEFQEEYDAYNLDEGIIQEIATVLEQTTNEEMSVRVTIVFGAWCGDSKEHVSHFIKLINHLQEQYFIDKKNEPIDYILIGCDRDKKTNVEAVDNSATNKIEFVPTFFFDMVKGDNFYKRLGTIVEKPNSSIEMDILEILKQ